MDVQFSGAIDYSPLFSSMNKYGPSGTPKTSGATFQNDMQESQQAILGPLQSDEEAQPFEDDGGNSVNVFA